MSIFKGRLSSTNKFTAQDDVIGLELLRGEDSSGNNLPSYISLEASDGVNWYIWFDDSDNLRKHTSAPTNSTKSAGSVITPASAAGADLQLSNIAGTVAIPVSIQSDTDITDDLGDASYRWRDTYTQDLYFDSSNYISGSTSNKIIFEAATAIEIGVDDDGVDTKFFGATSGSYMLWDESADSLIFTDDTVLVFGDASDFTIKWDATNLALDCKTDNTGEVAIGGTKDTDVRLNGATATYDILWDASADTLIALDNAKIAFGTGSDFHFSYDGTDFNLDAAAANDMFQLGENTVFDITVHGASGYDILWDASEDELIFGDNVEVIWGAGKDFQLESTGTHTYGTYGGTGSGLVLKAYAAQTVSALRIDGTTNDWDGADNVGMLHLDQDAALVNAGATLFYIGNSGKPAASSEGTCMRLEESGANTSGTYAVEWKSTSNHVAKFWVGATGVTPLTIIPHTSGTAAALKVDGDAAATSGWIGADDTGMLHVENDAANTHVGATLLFVENSAQVKASSEGALARFINTGTARADATMVEIAAQDDTEYAINVSAGISNFEAHGLCTAFGGGTDLTGTPTEAEFTGEFGATALTRPGFVGVAEDTSDGKNYLVVSDGTTWHYVALTAAS